MGEDNSSHEWTFEKQFNASEGMEAGTLADWDARRICIAVGGDNSYHEPSAFKATQTSHQSDFLLPVMYHF